MSTRDDRYRPGFHFTPHTGWMNDPNGPVFYEGEYHLFYQYKTPRHWGHAVSSDLVQWTELPVALSPDEFGEIFSGCVVADTRDTSGLFNGKEGLVAIYTNRLTHAERSTPYTEVQSIAYSVDLGRTWKKYEGNPVVTRGDKLDFRDPKVFWHEQSDSWIMVVATKETVSFYSSPNLREWSLASEFDVTEGNEGFVAECPDLFPLSVDGDPSRVKWVLCLSWFIPGPTSEAGMKYYVGDFNGATFCQDCPEESSLNLGYGDDYAITSWSGIPSSDGRRLIIGWMNLWKYAQQTPTSPWQGMMTIPRALELRALPDGLRLIQTPIRELVSLRGESASSNQFQVLPDSPFSITRDEEYLEIELTCARAAGGNFELGISRGEVRELTLRVDLEKHLMVLDRSTSSDVSFHDRFADNLEVPIPSSGNKISLRLFLDRCSVEVFVDGGERYAGRLVFPALGQTHISLHSLKEVLEVDSLVVTALMPTELPPKHAQNVS